MDKILEPLLAILTIVVPLGLAYVTIALQARKQKGSKLQNVPEQ
jgi:hypothetical protein